MQPERGEEELYTSPVRIYPDLNIFYCVGQNKTQNAFSSHEAIVTSVYFFTEIMFHPLENDLTSAHEDRAITFYHNGNLLEEAGKEDPWNCPDGNEKKIQKSTAWLSFLVVLVKEFFFK